MQVLVTKQTGPAGKPVNTLYIANKMSFANEMYFAILLDRATAGPMIIACSEGDRASQNKAFRHKGEIGEPHASGFYSVLQPNMVSCFNAILHASRRNEH